MKKIDYLKLLFVMQDIELYFQHILKSKIDKPELEKIMNNNKLQEIEKEIIESFISTNDSFPGYIIEKLEMEDKIIFELHNEALKYFYKIWFICYLPIHIENLLKIKQCLDSWNIEQYWYSDMNVEWENIQFKGRKILQKYKF